MCAQRHVIICHLFMCHIFLVSCVSVPCHVCVYVSCVFRVIYFCIMYHVSFSCLLLLSCCACGMCYVFLILYMCVICAQCHVLMYYKKNAVLYAIQCDILFKSVLVRYRKREYCHNFTETSLYNYNRY